MEGEWGSAAQSGQMARSGPPGEPTQPDRGSRFAWLSGGDESKIKAILQKERFEMKTKPILGHCTVGCGQMAAVIISQFIGGQERTLQHTHRAKLGNRRCVGELSDPESCFILQGLCVCRQGREGVGKQRRELETRGRNSQCKIEWNGKRAMDR